MKLAMCRAATFFFFFNDTATTEIYTLSLHDALPICRPARARSSDGGSPGGRDGWLARGRADLESGYAVPRDGSEIEDRKSTRLNSSHGYISYAVFCLKKKKHK